MATYNLCRIVTTSHAIVGDTATVRAEISEQLNTYIRVVDTITVQVPNYSTFDGDAAVAEFARGIYNAAQNE